MTHHHLRYTRPHMGPPSLGEDLPPGAGQPYRGFHWLADHLATLIRDQGRFAGAPATVPMLTDPASAQRDAFGLPGIPIPPTLTQPERHPA